MWNHVLLLLLAASISSCAYDASRKNPYEPSFGSNFDMTAQVFTGTAGIDSTGYNLGPALSGVSVGAFPGAVDLWVGAQFYDTNAPAQYRTNLYTLDLAGNLVSKGVLTNEIIDRARWGFSRIWIPSTTNSSFRLYNDALQAQPSLTISNQGAGVNLDEFAPMGPSTVAVVGRGGTVGVWNSTGNPLWTVFTEFTAQDERSPMIAYAPSIKRLAVLSGISSGSPRLYLIDSESGSIVSVQSNHLRVPYPNSTRIDLVPASLLTAGPDGFYFVGYAPDKSIAVVKQSFSDLSPRRIRLSTIPGGSFEQNWSFSENGVLWTIWGNTQTPGSWRVLGYK